MFKVFDKENYLHKNKEIESQLLYGNLSLHRTPIITVVMPVYNRPDMLYKALSSVLDQDTEYDYEVIVVDNNESKPSPNLDVVCKFNNDRVYYYQHTSNLGMYGNFNRGVELSRGKYITFCHDDDMFVENTLSLLISNTEVNPNACILGAHYTINGNDEITARPNYPQSIGGILKRKNYYFLGWLSLIIKCPGLGGGGDLFPKEVLLTIGGFNPNAYPASDYVLILNCALVTKIMQLPEPTYKYREAVNESFKLANTYADLNLEIHKQVVDKIGYNCLPISYILKILHSGTKNAMCKKWHINEISHISKTENFIIKILNGWCKLKCYKLSIK